MRLFALMFFCLSLSANAQNWALLNPAYKYNYSNDGTDTISNQIRVMHVDTLGPDSFRYELNRIGVVCDTCPASLGGPCDGCFVRVNQPQFLNRSALRSGNDWWFIDPDTIHIRTDAPMGTSWAFRPDSSIMATSYGKAWTILWGVPDSTITVALSNGSLLMLSRSFGIVRFPTASGLSEFQAIGVHGPDVGTLIPSLGQFFRYQPGDAVQFLGTHSANQHTRYSYELFEIDQRIDQPEHLVFTGTSHVIEIGYYGSETGRWSGPRTWDLDIATMRALRPVRSAPEQLLDLGGPMGPWQANNLMVMAEHGLRPNGHYQINGHSWSLSSIFYLSDTLTGDIAPVYLSPGFSSTYKMDTELGLREFCLGHGYSCDCEYIQGAVINGDTVGTFNGLGYFVPEVNPTVMYPLPADDHLTMPGAIPGTEYKVFDVEGRIILEGTWTSSLTLDLRGVRSGAYVLDPGPGTNQRFIIAR